MIYVKGWALCFFPATTGLFYEKNVNIGIIRSSDNLLLTWITFERQ